MVNNLEWFGGMGFLAFLRDIGKYARVSTMLAKDSVKSRMESESGISFTEFTYQLLQACCVQRWLAVFTAESFELRYLPRHGASQSLPTSCCTRAACCSLLHCGLLNVEPIAVPYTLAPT